jgi:hypothetical protein
MRQRGWCLKVAFSHYPTGFVMAVIAGLVIAGPLNGVTGLNSSAIRSAGSWHETPMTELLDLSLVDSQTADLVRGTSRRFGTWPVSALTV